MGQYFVIVNLDKQEYLDPSSLGCGSKLLEIAANDCLNVLAFLLRQSSEGGGGDIHKPYHNAGRWAGDRIAIVGDYDESRIWQRCVDGLYREVSQKIREEWNDFIEIPRLKIPRPGHEKCLVCGIEVEEKGEWYCPKHSAADLRIKVEGGRSPSADAQKVKGGAQRP
ncbi:MAG: hypothetical protein KA354_19750 [Phycisphaerae bacterium]|nr:hypothetical protein [Phycisphaerae bacterium]